MSNLRAKALLGLMLALISPGIADCTATIACAACTVDTTGLI